MLSSSKIDVLLTTDVHCFESTTVYGSDHHLIISHFYSRGICVNPPLHWFLVIRSFQKFDTTKLDELLTCNAVWDEVLLTFLNVWNVYEWITGSIGTT